VRKTRRGPWLSGLIIALIGAVWMAGQVIAGAIGLLGDLMFPPDPWAVATAPATGAPPLIDATPGTVDGPR
jgi:hypothetical protein